MLCQRCSHDWGCAYPTREPAEHILISRMTCFNVMMCSLKFCFKSSKQIHVVLASWFPEKTSRGQKVQILIKENSAWMGERDQFRSILLIPFPGFRAEVRSADMVASILIDNHHNCPKAVAFPQPARKPHSCWWPEIVPQFQLPGKQFCKPSRSVTDRFLVEDFACFVEVDLFRRKSALIVQPYNLFWRPIILGLGNCSRKLRWRNEFPNMIDPWRPENNIGSFNFCIQCFDPLP